MRFFLGTHETSWLAKPALANVPLFVSRERLIKRKSLPRATGPWSLDSGGFSQVAAHGRFTFTEAQYVAEVRRYRDEIGNLEWAAPMDWMCEAPMLAKTGLTVADHQWLTVVNYLELRRLAPGLPFIPVLQGQTLDDYQRCADLYAVHGVDLTTSLVGLGSVCRRQDTAEIGTIVGHFHAQGLRLHGFGCKAGAIVRYGQLLESADSLAWSKGGKERGACVHLKSRCANHLHYALDWRADILRRVPGGYSQSALLLDTRLARHLHTVGSTP
jgi:hypothetical protein